MGKNDKNNDNVQILKCEKKKKEAIQLGWVDNIFSRLEGALLAWQPSQTRASRARGVVFSLRLPA